jgi:hypothetical protein
VFHVHRPLIILLACLGLAAVSAAPRAIAASPIRPWAPPNADSLTVWAAESRARFQTNTGDSVGGGNYHAYELVGRMGRKLLQSLGREGMIQAHAIKGVLDSLGMDVEVGVDPQQPQFTLLMVRNPYRPKAAAVGYLYWYRDRDLRQQGVVFHGSHNPRMRVWWTADQDFPYGWGIVTDDRSDGDRMNLLLLRLNETATFWVLISTEGSGGPELGGPGAATWVDIDNTGAPELMTWTRTESDSSFTECTSCPHLLRERLYVERPDGFEEYDRRLLPSPYAAFTLFVRLLQNRDQAAASRLLEKPARVSEAVAAGWAKHGKRIWTLEYAEEVRGWPRWLAFKFQGPKGPVRYIVHFAFDGARWLIRDWVIPKPAETGKEIRP